MITKYISFPSDDAEELLVLADVWLLVGDRLNSKINPVTFNIEDQILVRSLALPSSENHLIKKFFLLYDGPYD